jgi:hypothetical protein
MKKWLVLSLIVFTIAGCSFIKGAIKDYNTGKDTPIAVNEISPAQQAAPYITAASAIPVVGGYSGILSVILVGFFTWKRGKKINQASSVGSVTPASEVKPPTPITP